MQVPVQLLKALQQPPLAEGIDLQGFVQTLRALIASGIDAVVQHEHIEISQRGIEFLFLAAAPADPFLRSGQGVLTCRLWSVTESDHPGTAFSEMACQCAAQLASCASDSHPAACPGL